MQTMTKTLNGAQILIKTLTNLGTDTIFGYPGGIVLNVYDELAKQNDIKHFLVRHEQAAIHAAEGYSRVTGKCGVCLVTSGPGATNIVTGLANAYLDNYPLVAITGQVSAELLHKDAFQEVDILDITKSCTKKGIQVKKASDLEKALIDAFQTAMSGRKGPVVVDITKNVFTELAEFSNDFKYSKIETCDIDLYNFKNAFMQAKKPLIIAGGGVIQSDACSELFKFSKEFNIPVVSSMMGIGAYPQDDENYIGMIGIFGQYAANEVVRQSDFVIAIGTRFNDRITCCFDKEKLAQKLVHIDIDEKEISKIIPALIGIVGDAKEVLNEMNFSFNKADFIDFSSWLKTAKNLQEKNIKPTKKSDNMHSFELIQEIQKCLEDKDCVITTEVGQHQVWASRYLRFNKPHKFITSGGLGTMGFGFPAAIGACVATGEPVVCIAGDGSFQMNIQELATCADYNLPIKIFVLNNGYLGMVRQFQEKSCEERYFATKISNPDFVKLAESYGAKGIRIENLKDVKQAIEEAFNYNGAFIIDFAIEPKELL